ncbi:hypothetical protein UFOVP1537_17 [uncultured Caudovirales phage]|uniref:Uncharacterized protein n=2 Tax=root TaxID=1 RepID=A0A6J5P778_9CAUD|nr:hypothetical protein UFOVP825_35 [uncultured Caudovirales phage]CAB4171212.1 hypothetical protein UFOVP915_17 [uncultured Caudovirales phage]CAB4177217.1 hypothetical protein UFOVP1000_34 [uncultured Caudovirales phage]CAB4182573.1 hypothetical protein UFOVP1092_9 [uncultured Caudovirales phage]CAB4187385.1 hypothetical protein UFOVP1152_13 [uncultured Caudovirales phage]
MKRYRLYAGVTSSRYSTYFLGGYSRLRDAKRAIKNSKHMYPSRVNYRIWLGYYEVGTTPIYTEQ